MNEKIPSGFEALAATSRALYPKESMLAVETRNASAYLLVFPKNRRLQENRIGLTPEAVRSAHR